MRKVEVDIFQNDSRAWTVTASFLQAVDKFYGTKLKVEFILHMVTKETFPTP